ncbi:MAG: S41 family peptidase [Bacteroidales bacterium]|nr:S41 family peptidase [Bacteroidales bacterium]
MRKVFFSVFAVLGLALFLVACSSDKDDPMKPKKEEKKEPDSQNDPAVEKMTNTYKYVNYFSMAMMSNYYLWIDEPSVQNALKTWSEADEPKAKVKAVRYKDSSGTDIDHWTAVYDHWSEETKFVEGVSTTFGYDVGLTYIDSNKDGGFSTGDMVFAYLTYVSANTPAEKAGLKRGDVVWAVNGIGLDYDNYYDLVNNKMFGASPVTLSTGYVKGNTVYKTDNVLSLTPVEMYVDPVLVYKVFEVNGKKVGYLHYTGFVAESYKRLIEACQYMKDQNVTELILDLRYNGGGLVLIEETLASMLAPEENVLAGDVFLMDIYNASRQQELGNEVSTLSTEFEFTSGGKRYQYSTKGSNIGISKIYAIITESTASASEAILCGLWPYLGESNIVTIGQTSSGKYCTGWMIGCDDMYIKDNSSYWKQFGIDYQTALQYADDWGIYVMVGRYADKDGKTRSMPNGLVPSVPANDDPLDGYALGDENETMLKVALKLAGKTYEEQPDARVAVDKIFKRIKFSRESFLSDKHIAFPEHTLIMK